MAAKIGKNYNLHQKNKSFSDVKRYNLPGYLLDKCLRSSSAFILSIIEQTMR